jgi:hypothetical protein
MLKGRKKGDRLPPFVPLTWKMLNSTAYKALPPSAAKALPYFFGKVKCTYNDPQRCLETFSFSYTEGKRLGFSPATFSKVIQALVRIGFIDPVDKGGLRGDGKSYNIFKLSKRWEDCETPNFKPLEWRCFIPKPR